MQFEERRKYYTKVNFKTSRTAHFQLLSGKWVASEGGPQAI